MANYMQYNRFDMANGPGVRSSIFFAGCSFHCQGCWNPSSWNPKNGQEFTQETIKMIIENSAHTAITGLSLLGGEPFQSIDAVLPLSQQFRKNYPNKNIWAWTGYTWDEIINDPLKKELLDYIDVLVDGQFILNQRDLSLQFRGSRNQRIIDVQKSLKNHKIELSEF